MEDAIDVPPSQRLLDLRMDSMDRVHHGLVPPVGEAFAFVATRAAALSPKDREALLPSDGSIAILSMVHAPRPIPS